MTRVRTAAIARSARSRVPEKTVVAHRAGGAERLGAVLLALAAAAGCATNPATGLHATGQSLGVQTEAGPPLSPRADPSVHDGRRG